MYVWMSGVRQPMHGSAETNALSQKQRFTWYRKATTKPSTPFPSVNKVPHGIYVTLELGNLRDCRPLRRPRRLEIVRLRWLTASRMTVRCLNLDNGKFSCLSQCLCQLQKQSAHRSPQQHYDDDDDDYDNDYDDDNYDDDDDYDDDYDA
jgi:hypothetical protein